MTLCECGCGEPAPVATMTSTARGHVKGEPLRFIVGHNTRKSFRRYRVDPETGCWIWQRARSGRYGQAVVDRRPVLAHRLAFIEAKGMIPPGFDVHHTCHEPLCVNPDHLVALSRRDHAQEHRPDECCRGHAFTPENTYTTKAGLRQCRACRRLRQRLARREKAAA